MASLDIEVLAHGTYQKYRQAQIRNGAPDGQLKDFILAPTDEAWNAFISEVHTQ